MDVFCSHASSNPFSIGKYPFFIYKIGLKNFARKKQKSLEKSRLFAAISFLSPFDGLPERIRTFVLQSRSLTRYPAVPRADIYGCLSEAFILYHNFGRISTNNQIFYKNFLFPFSTSVKEKKMKKKVYFFSQGERIRSGKACRRGKKQEKRNRKNL